MSNENRVTKDRIEMQINYINRMLNGRMNPHRIKMERRNGYYALDLYKHDTCETPIHTGNAKSVYTYLRGFRDSLKYTTYNG